MTSNKLFIFGIHSVVALLEHQPERILYLNIQKDRKDKKIEDIIKLATSHGIQIQPVARQVLDKVADHANHQGVIAFCAKLKIYTEADLGFLLKETARPPLVLVLDGVQDPHNLGACFRSADAAGVNAIIVPKDKSVGITPTVSKVASGAAEVIPFVQVTNLARALEALKALGFWIYGADAKAKQSLYQADLLGSTALVLGAEGKGLRRLTREHCDVLLNIPMLGSVASLNVSVAAGIFYV